MTKNPLAAIEFFAFIGLVAWLFVRQSGSSRDDLDEKRARQDEQAENDESSRQ
jgi:hypothetical protein